MCVTNRASCFARAMEMQRISHPDRKDEGKLPISWDAQEPIPHRAPSLPRRHCRQADKVRSHCRSIPALRQAGGGVIEQGWRASVSDSSRLLLQSSIVASLCVGHVKMVTDVKLRQWCVASLKRFEVVFSNQRILGNYAVICQKRARSPKASTRKHEEFSSPHGRILSPQDALSS